MRLSIRARMILAMNLLVAAVGSTVGFAGIEVATSQVAQRLVQESARNAADLFSAERLPLDSDALMAKSAKLFGAEAVSLPVGGSGIIASSLSQDLREELQQQIAPDGMAPPIVVLDSKRYCVGSALVRRISASRRERQERQLLLLVPEQRVIEAQQQVAGRIAIFTLLAILLATAVAFWLSTSIARPVRRLADRMDRLGSEPQSPPGPAKARPIRGPGELIRLEKSFDELLGRLASARRQIDRSARLAALGQLAASVAHELRNPLSGIKMNARVLADELKGEGQADQSIEHIIHEIDRMDLYLQELLSLASDSASSNSPLPPSEPVDLAEQADSVLTLLAGRCEHSSVTVETHCDPASPAAMADPQRARQVILNLMLNALDAMPHGGKLSISIAPASDGRAVRLEVADTGPGVHAEEGVDVFEPFVTTKLQGTGLGLYICKRTIESLDGRIGYVDGPQGATFWLELPAGDCERES